MQGEVAQRDDGFLGERRRRLAAERMLEHVRAELTAAHRALSTHVERVSAECARERDARMRLTGQTGRAAAARRAADQRAARAGRRLWHAVEAIRDGFAVWDADDTLLQANAPFARLFDGALEAEPGTPYAALMRAAAEEGVIDPGEADPEAWVAGMLARRCAEVPEPVTLRLFDGRSVRLIERRTEDGDVVSLALDVTAEVEREASLLRARAEAEAANKAKSRFLARMSHEFRTPMNGVIGMADLLLEEALEDDARLYVRTIRDSGLSLLDIVNDVLDAARLEAGQMQLRPRAFDLEQTLMQVVRLAAASGGAARAVTLDYPIGAPTRFRGDEARIRQVVTNLAGNAVKFAVGGDVTLRVSVTRPEGGAAARIAVEVADTGPGIPEARRDQVFGEFARLDPGGAEGTGLGLGIARDLARLMGGDLALAEPGEEGGARFVLTLALPPEGAWPAAPALPPAVRLAEGASAGRCTALARLRAAGVRLAEAGEDAPLLVPLDLSPEAQAGALAEAGSAPVVLLGPRAAAAPGLLGRAAAVLPDPCEGAALARALCGGAAAVPPAPAAETPPRGLRILTADDVGTNRLLITRMLGGEGREIEAVEDGDVAVERFRADPHDLVLLDISMPRMDGREAARLIRAAPEGARVPIVAMTAHAAPEEIEDIRRAGIDEVLLKPVRKPELLELLGRLEPRLRLPVPG
ncbi:ATP-binding protein [Jannaschia sp. W003]|uniref:ATP-binding protein n=1 Tax=Jannaschia sp. W003 TaxID=2867012 RepID=UPI0021A5915C|nr:ATP-binding protein [Jannaschia sp. W003]UWQ21453.1 response regulator [Jannaschia sp. W003]